MGAIVEIVSSVHGQHAVGSESTARAGRHASAGVRPAPPPVGLLLILNRPTSCCSSAAIRDSSAAAFWVSLAPPCRALARPGPRPAMFSRSRRCPWPPRSRCGRSRWWWRSAPPPRVAMVFWMSLIWLMIVPIWPMASTAPLVSAWMASILLADVLGGLGRLLGQFLDLVGDDGEALARLAGAGRFDGGVQGQQVGLLGDGGDDLDDLADLGADSRPAWPRWRWSSRRP